MNNDPSLPLALTKKLKEAGYEVDDVRHPLDLGAEKFIYGATLARPGEGCAEPVCTGVVLLYSKRAGGNRWAWKYERELEVFQDLRSAGAEHRHIIRMLDFFDPVQCEAGGSHGPCMVLEKVDPLGFDLFKVVKQYQGAKARTLPVDQWMHYLGQLLEAVEHLHNRGWVHCDIKPDNVMVDTGHEIKVIDFGYARRFATDQCPGRTSLYAPPEFEKTHMKVDKSADLWLIGAMMFVVFAQMQVAFYSGGRLFEVTSPEHARKYGVCAAIKHWWGKTVDSVVSEAIDNLLQRDPLKRWDLGKLQKWWRTVKGNLRSDSFMKLGSSETSAIGWRFCKAPPVDRLVKAFGLEVQAGSDVIGKYIGSHRTKDGELIEGKDRVIDFRKFAGATVLFIDREPEIVKFPSAKDRVQLGDWVYYLLHEDMEMETEEQREFQHRAQEARSVGVEIWLEFDWFEFPEFCAGATLGEIGMGKLFGINVHFLAHGSETAATEAEAEAAPEPGRDALAFAAAGRDSVVLPGDRGLVCRVPDRTSGRSHSILTDELLDPLFEEPLFRQRLGLQEPEQWQDWRARCAARLAER